MPCVSIARYPPGISALLPGERIIPSFVTLPPGAAWARTVCSGHSGLAVLLVSVQGSTRRDHPTQPKAAQPSGFRATDGDGGN